MGQAQNRLQRTDQRAARGALLGLVAGLDLHLGDFQIPVAELVPDEVVNGIGHVVEAELGKALGHFSLDLLQLRADPAVGLAEVHIASELAARLALLLGVGCQAAVMAFAVHQHKARSIPELVAEVAIALAALAVEVDAAAQRCQGGKGEAQCVRSVGGDAFGEFLLSVLAHLRGGLGLAQAGGALFQQRLQRDAVDQIHGVQHIAFGLAHLLALRIAHQAVDVDMLERHATCEVRGHHDHAGDPEENDVVARHQYRGGQVEVVVIIGRVALIGPAHGAERHHGGGVPGVQHVGIAGQLLARETLSACAWASASFLAT